MLRIDTVRVDKAESKEDLYLMSLRVSANTNGLKDLSNAIDNVLYTIEHSEALLSEPVGLIDVDDESTRYVHRENALAFPLAEEAQIPKIARVGDTLPAGAKITRIDYNTGHFYYVISYQVCTMVSDDE